ncbi:glycosyltransferase [Pseudodesulfovibrio sp. JC047]|uniref:glycosyltransferase family 2 protein n=1 Tax=Pseudodesulfovibrio sp. JC047 TaxID=2683199 RepID=UPI0013D205A2|nr:glycosyltransferase [Pseudodesulfovibrio sp. JC047]NDV20628.1 glycosyltransferase [Pseudodesulfovibrio sp. JC047]
MNKISIVVPSYNHSKYLEACLDSLMFQDYENMEIIIVDDCSTDGSRDIIQRYVNDMTTETRNYAHSYNAETDHIERVVHPRYPQGREITVLFNEQNMGSTATYNRGFRATTGKYCSFVTSDDICHPQMYSTLVQPLEQNIADFVYADMFVIDDARRIVREFKLPEYSFKKSFCDWYLCGVATLYRRELHERFGFYDENSNADDHECYLRFAMNGARFLHVPKTVYDHRSHDDRQVGLHEPAQFDKLLTASKELVLKARKHLKNSTISDEKSSGEKLS